MSSTLQWMVSIINAFLMGKLRHGVQRGCKESQIAESRSPKILALSPTGASNIHSIVSTALSRLAPF